MIVLGPGRDLRELADRRGPVALLFNGPSLPVDWLSLVKIPKFGMNRTHIFEPELYLAMEPEYLSVPEVKYFLNATTFMPKKAPANAGRGWRVPLAYTHTFSCDIDAGFFPGSTGFLAFQAALALGFQDLFCLGLDLSGPHFDSSPSSVNTEWENQLFCDAASRLPAGRRVFLCGSPNSKCTAFPHYPLAGIL